MDALLKFLAGVFMLWRNRLTSEEIDILLHTEEEGVIYKVPASFYGSAIRAGKRDFFDKDDASYTARYYDAFERLLDRKFVRPQKGMLYRLTGAGFRAAKRIKAARSSRPGTK